MSTTSVTPMFDDFVKFCSEQPSDIRIIHSEAYDECAIGEFKRHIESGESAYTVMTKIKSDLSPISKDLAEVFHDTIGNANGNRSIATYGGLTKWLLQFQHDVNRAAQ